MNPQKVTREKTFLLIEYSIIKLRKDSFKGYYAKLQNRLDSYKAY
jgi:hypothetical protein